MQSGVSRGTIAFGAIALGALSLRLVACVGSDPIDPPPATPDSGSSAAQGAESGPCFPNDTCLAGLSCISKVCVRLGGGFDGDGSTTNLSDSSSNDSGGRACTHAVPSGGPGPRCPGEDAGVCYSEQACCLGASPPSCASLIPDGGIFCPTSPPVHRCETRAQCGNLHCCLKHTGQRACDFDLDGTSCRSECAQNEVELCGSGEGHCPTATTCKPIRLSRGGVEWFVGGCL